jgi:opacity protein-like surface antigen
VAAPTAGLHFTPEVLSAIDACGIDREEVTLHVGAGTFRPVKSADIGGHEMHTEYIAVRRETLQKLLDHDSNEFLFGAEWDLSNKITISAGGQLTRYGLTDQYMNDMSFVVNSYSYGFGFNYKVRDNVKLKFAFFQTEYGDYDRITSATVSDSFTRTSRVLGLGCDIDL